MADWEEDEDDDGNPIFDDLDDDIQTSQESGTESGEPDLVVEDVSYPSEIVSGKQLEGSVTVACKGESDTCSPHQMDVIIDNEFVTAIEVGDIGAGQSVTYDINVPPLTKATHEITFAIAGEQKSATVRVAEEDEIDFGDGEEPDTRPNGKDGNDGRKQKDKQDSIVTNRKFLAGATAAGLGLFALSQMSE